MSKSGDGRQPWIEARSMSGIFHQIESSTRKIFGDGPVCVHVGNVKDCDIKRHPTYPKFRAEAILAGSAPLRVPGSGSP